MQIPPLWLALLAACALAVPLVIRLFRTPPPPRSRLAFDPPAAAAGGGDARPFRLGRLSLDEVAAERKP